MYNIKFSKITYNNLISNYDEEGKTLFEDGFGELFDIKITPIIYQDYYIKPCKVLKYEFILKYSSYKDPFYVICVDENDNYIMKKCSIDGSFVCKHFYALVRYVESLDLKLDYDKYEQAFSDLEEEKRKEEYKKKRKETLQRLGSFIEEIDNFDVLTQNEKMSIECRADLGDVNTLSIRVGSTKKFVVPNIQEFLGAIKNNELLTYGKKFSFVHSLDSFDDFSKKVITFLASFASSEQYSKKELFLTPIKFERLIELHKKKYLHIGSYNENSNYFVTETKVSPKLFLDENFMLTIKGALDLIEGYTKDYLLINNKIVEVDNNDPAYRKLLSLVMKDKGLSFKYIKDVFEKKIYPRFSENIEISPEVADKIKTGKYQIESYFDLNDEGIILQSKYFKDGKEIQLSKINDVPYKIKRYLSYIKNLGFVDDKINDPSHMYNFLHADLTDLKKISDIYLSDNIKDVKTKKMQRVSARMSYKTGMLDICFEESGFSDEELFKIINSLKKKIRFVKLNKNTIIEVDEEDAEKLLNTINTFKLDPKKLNETQNVPLYQTLKIASDDLDIIDYTIDDSLKKLINEIVEFKKLDIKVPSSLKNVLREYQVDAYKWMKVLSKHNFCGVLADDMGLGKTLEVISVILSSEEKKPSLIVCPKSLCYNWKNEFSLWAKELDVVNVIGNINDRKDIISKIDEKKKVIYISSYDSLRNDIDLYKNVKFNYLILDEAQSIKNHNTLKAKSVKKIKSIHRFVLTGTPIENSVVDLWSIFDFLMPEYLGDYSNFRSRYEEAVVSGNADEVSGALIRKISPFVLRRTKKEVLKDLPDKIETIQIASMEEKQRLIYEAQLRKTREILTNPKASKIEILSSLTRLRQICVHPQLYLDNYDGRSAKFDLLMELLEDYIATDHKVIIFSQFTSAFTLLEPLLNDKKYEYFLLTGKTSAEDRISMANRFNDKDDKHKVFLVSLKAGGTGLNLIGDDIVIHLDPWWNYAVENQATDRAHRIGQKNVVQVIKMICENSIEQKVIELQRIKKEVAERIILSDEENYNNINLTDLKYLLD